MNKRAARVATEIVLKLTFWLAMAMAFGLVLIVVLEKVGLGGAIGLIFISMLVGLWIRIYREESGL